MAIKKVRNGLNDLYKELSKINKEYVEVGHFEEQGMHYSKMTYPELMRLHHSGYQADNGVDVAPRPVLDYVFLANLGMQDDEIRKEIKSWLSRKPSTDSNKKLLDKIGLILARKEKSIFGETPPLAPNRPYKQPSSPLVETGDLKEHVSYRNSITRRINQVPE